MRWRLEALGIAAAASLGGCDLAFGVDHLDVVHNVTVQHTMREVRNDGSGAPVIAIVDYDPQITVELADGSVPEINKLPDRTLKFPRVTADQPYRLVVEPLDTRDPQIEYQFSTPALRITDRIIGRARRDDADAGATVTQTISNAPAGSTSYLTTTGLWTQTPHTSGTGGSTNQLFTFEWRGAVILFGRIGISSPSLHDRTFAITMQPVAVSGARSYSSLTQACESVVTANSVLGFDSVQLDCQVVAVPKNRCIHVRTRFEQEDARIVSALPPSLAHPTVAQVWSVAATPAPALLPRGNLLLARFFNLGASTDAPIEWDDPIDYANPYPDHGVTVIVQSSRNRSLSLAAEPSLIPMLLDTKTLHWQNADAACPATSEPFEPVAIAGGASLAGTPLDTDDTLIAMDPGSDVQLTWTDAAPGAADVYAVTLYRVVPFFGRVARFPVRVYVTPDRSITIDPAVLELDVTYLFEIETRVGFPAAATGDLETFAYPATTYATAIVWTSSFVRR